MSGPVDFSDLPVRLQEIAFRSWLEPAIGKNIVWMAEATGGGPAVWHCTAGTLTAVRPGDAQKFDGRTYNTLHLEIEAGVVTVAASGMTDFNDSYSYAITDDEMGSPDGDYEWSRFCDWIEDELKLESA